MFARAVGAGVGIFWEAVRRKVFVRLLLTTVQSACPSRSTRRSREFSGGRRLTCGTFRLSVYTEVPFPGYSGVFPCGGCTLSSPPQSLQGEPEDGYSQKHPSLRSYVIGGND